MTLPEVDPGLAISGVFEVEPCRLNYLIEKLPLPPEDVRPMLASPEGAICDAAVELLSARA